MRHGFCSCVHFYRHVWNQFFLTQNYPVLEKMCSLYSLFFQLSNNTILSSPTPVEKLIPSTKYLSKILLICFKKIALLDIVQNKHSGCISRHYEDKLWKIRYYKLINNSIIQKGYFYCFHQLQVSIKMTF